MITCIRRRFPIRSNDDRSLRFGFCYCCNQHVQAIGEFELHGLGYDRCQIFRADTPLKLPAYEARILWIFVLRRGRLTSTQDLIEAMYPDPDNQTLWEESAIKQHMSRLRKKIHQIGVKIKTTYYIGFEVVI